MQQSLGSPLMIDSVTNISTPDQAGIESSPSSILEDVAVHQLSSRVAEEQLHTFHRAFIPMFPFVHIPVKTTAADLLRQKPFLWLVIMALTTKNITQQFAMEETIWSIIAQRIVTEHLANLDLLLGLICFASWYHTLHSSYSCGCR